MMNVKEFDQSRKFDVEADILKVLGIPYDLK